MKVNLEVLNDDEILSWILPWCDKAERSPSDAIKRMMRYGLNTDRAQAVLEKLIQKKMIDPSRFAHAFAHDHFQFHKWGKNKIKAALYAKGIGLEVIADAIGQIESSDEKQEIMLLIAKKKIPPVDFQERSKWKASVARSLIQKGYNAVDVFSCLQEFLANTDSANVSDH